MKIIFVYNADAGLFNGLADMAHKIFAPQTYACRLCALTYSNFGMRREWQEFLQKLDVGLEFLHRDELRKGYGIADMPLPAIFKKENGKVELWIDAAAINQCETLDDVKRLVSEKLSEENDLGAFAEKEGSLSSQQ